MLFSLVKGNRDTLMKSLLPDHDSSPNNDFWSASPFKISDPENTESKASKKQFGIFYNLQDDRTSSTGVWSER
jgi:hypothetical protein